MSTEAQKMEKPSTSGIKTRTKRKRYRVYAEMMPKKRRTVLPYKAPRTAKTSVVQGIMGMEDTNKTEIERRLEEMAFGCSSRVIDNCEDDDVKDSGLEDSPESETMETDEIRTAVSDSDRGSDEDGPLKPAWFDPDDTRFKVKHALNAGRLPMVMPNSMKIGAKKKYSAKLEEKFVETYGTPSWAKLECTKRRKHDSEDESDEEFKQSARKLVSHQRSGLKPTLIGAHRVKNINGSSRPQGHFIRGIEFHPTENVAVVAGRPGIATLYQIDGRENQKIQSVCFENFPIRCIHLNKEGSEIIATSEKQRYFYTYDLMSGKTDRVPWNMTVDNISPKEFRVSPDGRLLAFLGSSGQIHLLTANSKEWIATLKMNGSVSDAAFNSDGTKLYSNGDMREVYIWDVRRRACLQKFEDEGCVSGTVIAASPNDQYLTTGCSTGVVNVYDAPSLTHSIPKPIKTLPHLVTSATHLNFNPTSEILAMASYDKENSLRLVHMPTLSVFSNFHVNYDVSKPQCVGFSKNSGYMAVGNEKGTALLYRLKHYPSY